MIRIRTVLRVIFLGISIIMTTPQYAHAENKYATIKLYEGVASGSKDFTGEEHFEERGTPEVPNGWVTGVSKPSLTVIEATTKAETTSAIIICPGGGYGGLAWDKEGIEVAEWLATLGVKTFVLKYRHGGGLHQHPIPLVDAQRAVRLVRSRAEEFGIQPDRIGVMGFSAGGHVASSVGTHFDAGSPAAGDPLNHQSCRPDFLMLIYPVISMDAAITHGGSLANLLGAKPDPKLVELMSNDTQVTDQTPPTFIAHASDDEAVPVENALRFYRALVAHKVPAELHVFAEGGHGFGMRQPGPVEEWPTLLANWLKSRKLIN